MKVLRTHPGTCFVIDHNKEFCSLCIRAKNSPIYRRQVGQLGYPVEVEAPIPKEFLKTATAESPEEEKEETKQEESTEGDDGSSILVSVPPDYPQPSSKSRDHVPKGSCIYLSDPVRKIDCPSCGKNSAGKAKTQVKVFGCDVYGECTIAKPIDGIDCCAGKRVQKEFQPCRKKVFPNELGTPNVLAPDEEKEKEPDHGTVAGSIRVIHRPAAKAEFLKNHHRVEWAYAITTVPSRRKDLFPQTLQSLKLAGFDKPLLSVDGDDDGESWRREFGLEVLCRSTNVRTAGNWFSTLLTLYCYHPNVDRYAIFQDDFVTYRNLKEYLSACPYPEKSYLNLYTFPENYKLMETHKNGWYPSNQRGKGAVALVFNHEAVVSILQSQYMVERFQDKKRGHKAVDGGVVMAFRAIGWREMCHNPSLVQHTGRRSSMGNAKQPLSPNFRGEEFDARELIVE